MPALIHNGQDDFLEADPYQGCPTTEQIRDAEERGCAFVFYMHSSNRGDLTLTRGF